MSLNDNDRERLRNICPATEIAKFVVSPVHITLATSVTQVKASVDIATGLATVFAFVGSVVGTATGGAYPGTIKYKHSGTAGTVTVFTMDGDDGAASTASCDVAWIAFGL